MAIFRKRVSPQEFGAAILYYVEGWLMADACRALAQCIEDSTHYDASRGWLPFLESKGVADDQLRSYIAFVIHCSLHATALQYEPAIRNGIVRGAMANFKFTEPPAGYDFDRVYSLLENFYSGSRRFDDAIERLKSTETLAHFLPRQFQSAGIINARFLLVECIIPNMKISKDVIENFLSFSSTINSIVALVQRGTNAVLRDVKL